MNTNQIQKPTGPRMIGGLVAAVSGLLLSYAILAPAPAYEYAAPLSSFDSTVPAKASIPTAEQQDWSALPEGAVTPAETVAAYDR